MTQSGNRKKKDLKEIWWDARLEALESILGEADEMVGHGPVPFEMGPDQGGTADIVYFHHHTDGVVAVTAELIGNENQFSNCMGNYELAFCTKTDDSWGASLISQLAHYTLETPLEPGETMDISPATPKGSSISAFLFCDYGEFKVKGKKAGILMCVGITEAELEVCQNGQSDQILSKLKKKKIFPFTDLHRKSII